MNPLLLVDSYKVHHVNMYPEGMTKLYSNFTPRKSRILGVDKVVFFGLQHFCLEYLIHSFNWDFFVRDWEEIEKDYTRHIPVDVSHIKKLHELQYLPIEIKALPEGTQVPIGVPCLTITNTHPDFAWLVNYLETLLSCMLWQPITSATIAYEYKKLLTKYALETTGSSDFVQWQGHDFSMRGMSSVESAILSGMGHLLSFTGTDTIPAIYQLEQSYNATGLIGASVPATEHSVMCMGTREDEVATFKRLLGLYPTGILSVVSDTWNLWKVLTEYLPAIKNEVLTRDGKLVIRPDSGDPVDIICGLRVFTKDEELLQIEKEFNPTVVKGVIELLWDLFGGTYVTGNDGKQYKCLDSHIGAIYGDSITLGRAEAICERLKAKGFASTNVVLGIGSYTYQFTTRDTFGFAMKATYGEIGNCSCKNDPMKCSDSLGNGACTRIEPREIFKDPITDDGTKKSKKGLLRITRDLKTEQLVVHDQQSWEEESTGLLETVFKDSQLVRTTTLEEIRERLKV
jgi:nicotinamide phosphoribosyltransferase